MATVGILGVHIPHTSGGAEALIKSLAAELANRGHTPVPISLPIEYEPKEGLLNEAAIWRSHDFTTHEGQTIDLIIATKFPTYYATHPAKSVWLVHQHRQIYDLYGSEYTDFSDDPRDEVLRQLLTHGDSVCFQEADYLSGISQNVVDRIRKYNALDAEVLYPPLPLGERYRSEQPEKYVLSVGRLCGIKRVDMMIKALSYVESDVTLKVVGTADEPGIMEDYREIIETRGLEDRVEFLGRVDDETLIDLYSRALAVYYAPYDEDYGYVTLEGFASGRPVLSATDSGGVLEFVIDQTNGFVVEPDEKPLARAVNELARSPKLAKQLGANGLEFIQGCRPNWDTVINGLLSPLDAASPMKQVSVG